MSTLEYNSSPSSQEPILKTKRVLYRNKIRGTVISIRHDLRWVTVGLATEGNLPLTIRWRTPANVAPNVEIGEQLLASLRSDQVLLGSDSVWPGPEAWNRWRGRIVLMNQKGEPPAITVKPRGVTWTLVSTNPVEGCQSSQTGHAVNIVIDPAALRLRSDSEEAEPTEIRSPQSNLQSISAGRVSLRGRVKLIRHMSSACWLWIEVGTAQVSAIVNGNHQMLDIWALHQQVEIFISGSQAWLRPQALQIEPIPCSLVYPDSKDVPREIFEMRP